MIRPFLAALLLAGLAVPSHAAPVSLCEGRLQAEVSGRAGGGGLERHATYSVRVENMTNLPLTASVRVDGAALLDGDGDGRFLNAAAPMHLGPRASFSQALGNYRGAAPPPAAEAVQRHLRATCGNPRR